MSDVSSGLVHEAEVMLRKVGATRENFWVPISKDPEVARRVVKAVGVGPIYEVYEVVVNLDLTRPETIEAGKYDWVHSNITQEHFPGNGSGKQNVNIVLFDFDRIAPVTFSIDEVLREVDKAGYRMDDIDEHLALGAQYPELQKRFPIACLGSVWKGSDGHYVPCLGECDAGRGFGLLRLDRDWSISWRFAVVHK